jgi:hypothetical protein
MGKELVEASSGWAGESRFKELVEASSGWAGESRF